MQMMHDNCKSRYRCAVHSTANDIGAESIRLSRADKHRQIQMTKPGGPAINPSVSTWINPFERAGARQNNAREEELLWERGVEGDARHLIRIRLVSPPGTDIGDAGGKGGLKFPFV